MIDLLLKRKVIAVVLVTLLAFLLRVYRLDAAGLSEDESKKVAAVASYREGDFTANGEHPMLMKLMCGASVITAEKVNNVFETKISTESALRFPNVLFGALTTLILFLFFNDMFGFRVGFLTAFFWAISTHSILINRVAKEDTLMVFFTWLAFYFFRKGKKLKENQDGGKKFWYGLSGTSFGLMLASKYFPHYMGINFLFHHLLGETSWNKKIKGKHYLAFFTALFAIFFLVNPSLFIPGMIDYMYSYLKQQTLTHHGYWMMDTLYHNDAGGTPGNLPFYFYLMVLAIKTQIPMLLVFLIGMVEIFRKRGDENYFFLKFMFLMWLVPFSFFGAKWVRYILSLIPSFCAIGAVGLSLLYDICKRKIEDSSKGWLIELVGARKAAWVFTTSLMLIFLIYPMINTIKIAPFYSLYLNELVGSKRVGYFFPHDEFYDLGLREAIRFVARKAERGASVATEAPGVFQFYQHRFNREDLEVKVTSDPNFKLTEIPPTYVILQDGRRYFENIHLFNYIETNYEPIKEVHVVGGLAAKIYKISDRSGQEQAFANSPTSTISANAEDKKLIVQ